MPKEVRGPVAAEAEKAAALVTRAHALLVYHHLLEQSPLRELVALLDLLSLEPSLESSGHEAGERDGRAGREPGAPRGDMAFRRRVLHAYGALFRALAETALSGLAREPAVEREDGRSLAGAPRVGVVGAGSEASPGQEEPGEAAARRLDAFRAALAEAILLDENPFSEAAARVGARLEQLAGSRAGPAASAEPATGLDQPPVVEHLPEALVAAAAADLRILQELAAAAARLPATVAQTARAAGLAGLPALPLASSQDDGRQRAAGLAPSRPFARLATALDWGALVPELAAYYATHGTGLFARYRAFRWLGPASGGLGGGSGEVAGEPVIGLERAGGTNGARAWLVPVPVPDAVQPDDLIGYEAERALLRRNTAYFLAGYAANNVLLYGDRGTGKSSSIKALLNEQRARHAPGSVEAEVDWSRLRLIEVPKARLIDFPLLVALLRDRPQRFIVFVDDLSFEEGETGYKHLKALLEGGLEARPPNVVVYATSNRRHLVRELFADRPPPDVEEVHARDTMQEKLSFADRFGLVITFPSPDQALYLAIVEGLARRRGLAIERAALRARAIEWAAWHNGRSGRTARQFIDHLTAELGLAAAALPAGSEG